MSRVADLLHRKGHHVHTIEPDATVQHAVEELVRHGIGSLLVASGGDVQGIFTERDYLRRVAMPRLDPEGVRVREVMTDRLVCAEPGMSVEDCMSVMTARRIRHLPVFDGPRLAGLVSIGDLVAHLNAEREVEVRWLHDYIAGRYPA
jgi:CBS domain-containing protein